MSLSTSLSSALSGLSATARAAEVVSSNVANANTPGYAVRRLEVTSASMGTYGSGVRIVGVDRQVNERILADRWISDGAASGNSVLAQFHRQLEAALGLPTEEDSLTSAMTRLESAMVDAVSKPESTARLEAVINQANLLTGKINSVSDQINATRQNAEDGISKTVDRLNTSLQQVYDLNTEIRRNASQGRPTATLMDQRQTLIDGIAEDVPLRAIDRGNGQIALFTTGGATLLDGLPAEFGFNAKPAITADMTVANGGLATLTLNGKEINVTAERGLVQGGRLAALFTVRDIEAPQAQARIDAVARDMIERFQDPSVDTTLAANAPGLFTDADGAFVSTNEVGLASRLSVNSIVDPSLGGDIAKLRDGIGSTTAGPVGDAGLLQRLSDAMTTPRTLNSGDFVTSNRSSSALMSDLLSVVSSDRNAREVDESFAVARSQALLSEQLKDGVDTDFELQQLLVIEQAYAANARIVEVVGEMLDTLGRL